MAVLFTVDTLAGILAALESAARERPQPYHDALRDVRIAVGAVTLEAARWHETVTIEEEER